MKYLFSLFKTNYTKILSVVFFLALSLAYMQTFAAPQQKKLVLDPSCGPADASCYVSKVTKLANQVLSTSISPSSKQPLKVAPAPDIRATLISLLSDPAVVALIKSNTGLTLPANPTPQQQVYMPVTQIQPNPSQNFNGATLFSATNLSSQSFNTSTATIANTLNVTGSTNLTGNLSVSGTITGSVAGTINPNLTTGSILFQGASGLAEDNANFFWDDTNDRLGIGTTAPLSLLTIGSGTPTTAANGFNFGTDTAANLYRSAASTIKTDGNLAVTGTSTLTGHIGLSAAAPDEPLQDSTGGTSSALSVLSAKESFTATSGFHVGLSSAIYANPSANSTMTLHGARTGTYTNAANAFNVNLMAGAVNIASHLGTGTVTSLMGIDIIARNNNVGAVTEQIGARALIANSTTGTIGTAYGFQVRNLSNAGTITNTYGVYVGDITAGTQTNGAYSFYASDANALNYFAGNVGIGTTAPLSLLTIGSGTPTTAANGFNFGTDTAANLYRSAASTIKTDGNFVVTGTLTIPSPFTLGATSVTSTGTQLNYLNAATGTTGTTSTNLVFSTSPTLVTPILGVATGTSLALGGATIGSNALAVTGSAIISGNVGIGTTAPGGLLHISGNSARALAITDASANDIFTIDTTTSTASAGIDITAGGSQVDNLLNIKSSGGTILSSFGPDGTLTLNVGSTTAFSVQNGSSTSMFNVDAVTGNVGIGTTTATAILALDGTAARTIQMERNTTAATAGQGLTINSGGAIAGTADLAGGDLTLKSGIATGSGTSAIRFFTTTAGASATTDRTPTEKMTILGNGNVGIGTITPVAPFEVKGTGTGATIAKFTDVNTTGCTLATGGTIACSSDSRLKKNITDINYGIDTIIALRPVLYNWNYEADSDSKSLGFIAQEVESIVPKLVTTDSDGMKSLNTTGVIPILTKATQDLGLRLEAIANVSTLEAPTDSFVDAFFSNVYSKVGSWLASAGNSVTSVYANIFNAREKICVDGECLTKDNIRDLLLLVNPGGSTPTPEADPTPTPEPEPEPEPEVTPDPSTSSGPTAPDPEPTPEPEPEVTPEPEPDPTPTPDSTPDVPADTGEGN
jgi:hypothetical protein